MPNIKIKKQIISITGATATGKSHLALKLAQNMIENQGVRKVYLLSVDSRQVYQGLEILTASDIPHGWSPVEKKPYRHFTHPSLAISLHGISIIPIWQEWSPAHLKKIYLDIKKQLGTKDLLILVGGTGFYHSQILKPANTLSIPPNPVLRKNLNHRSAQSLQEELKKINPEKLDSMNHSDSENPRRLIRAIEVTNFTNNEKPLLKSKKENILSIHLVMARKERDEKIKRRVSERFKHAIHEVRACLEQFKLSSELEATNTIGFNELLAYLDHQLSSQQALQKWQIREIQYAKRQDTWWKKIPGLISFEANDPELLTKITTLVL